ncbi:hypothetical protein [Paenibacillus polymyxa]|uniref:Uncharacterized protein n=1 Tax=Paenibacillus polymyxa (strain SC2) TaxID=886882 RepID=E3E8N7_PAEPS|nr:hypothetical protein [Paenibacillus polymyxa]ADO57746.1 hypothetical protein PPSC2_17725 [Paenibacillus polymyxa SC2]WPQ55485.1 hypothetical protein SKN87_18040 [Paenibacillus polymyxa]CCI70378.1 hypothetical protein PPM_3569 [Paenibacillus polymyxa M1]
MKAYENFKEEMHKIELLYAGSVNSYWQNKLRNSERIEAGFIKENDPIYYEQGNNFRVTISSNKQEFDQLMKIELPQVLRETIFIRLISILENFFMDLIKELFATRKDLFQTNERIEYSQGEILSFDSLSSLHTNIINSECRRIQNQGIQKVSEYFKKKFKIDFNLSEVKLKKIVEMHDRRNILVHRIGKTDDIYRKKYKFEGYKLTVEKKYIVESFESINLFAEYIYGACEKLLKTDKNISSKDPRFSVEIVLRTLTTEYVPVLDRSFSFLCNEEILYLKDVIYRYHYDNSEKIHTIKMSGSPSQMKCLIDEFTKPIT